MLVQLEPGVLLTVGCGKCGEPASEAEHARNPAHHQDRGAAGRCPGWDAAPADVAVPGTGCPPLHPPVRLRSSRWAGARSTSDRR